MTDIVERLRRACKYENVSPDVRSFQACATNGLVLDAATQIERMREGLQDIAIGCGDRILTQEEMRARAFYALGTGGDNVT